MRGGLRRNRIFAWAQEQINLAQGQVWPLPLDPEKKSQDPWKVQPGKCVYLGALRHFSLPTWFMVEDSGHRVSSTFGGAGDCQPHGQAPICAIETRSTCGYEGPGELPWLAILCHTMGEVSTVCKQDRLPTRGLRPPEGRTPNHCKGVTPSANNWPTGSKLN